MNTSPLYLSLMVAVCLAGCNAEQTAESSAEQPAAYRPWAPLAVVSVDPVSGTTSPVHVAPDNLRRALRVSAKPAGCLRVSSAVSRAGEILVGSSSGPAGNRWRTTPLYQTGLFVLEGAASDLASLSFESVQCDFGDEGELPLHVEVESLLSQVPSNPGLRLRLVLSESTKTTLDVELLAQQVGLELELEIAVTQVALIEDANLVMQSQTDFSALAEILAALPQKQEGIIDVVIGPCLAQETAFGLLRMTGITPRIPGGAGPADAVFIARAHCDFTGALPFSAEEFARLTAHELGHYLGLEHTQELNGREDDFPSTNNNNLMHRIPLTANATGLTTEQRERILAHPFVMDF